MYFYSSFKNDGKYFLKVNLKNEGGGKDKIMYELNSSPSVLTGKDYEGLLETLRTKSYERS